MKNTLILLLVLNCSAILRAGSEGKEESRKGVDTTRYVSVLSDLEDQAVTPGFCVIRGKLFFQTERLQDSVLITENKLADKASGNNYFVRAGLNAAIPVNPDGTFELKIDTAERFLIFYKLREGNDDIPNYYEEVYLEHYRFLSQHVLVLEAVLPIAREDIYLEVDKPVIYAYSDQPLDFTLKLQSKGKLGFTYPALDSDQTWKMKTGPFGQLQDEKGQVFPYLFWESKQKAGDFANSGSLNTRIVSKSRVVPFLEDALDKFGFNAREKTDFITFWAPQLIRYDQVEIRFLLDEDCNTIAGFNIEPQPDQLRRVFMLFHESKEQSLNGIDLITAPKRDFKRSGFVLLEWGGAEIPEADQ